MWKKIQIGYEIRLTTINDGDCTGKVCEIGEDFITVFDIVDKLEFVIAKDKVVGYTIISKPSSIL